LPLTVEKPAGSTVPDGFSFGGELGVPQSTLIASQPSTIYGINAPASISVIDGEYSVNGGPFVASAGFVNNRDRVRVRRVSPSTPGTTAYATLVVGGDATGSFS